MGNGCRSVDKLGTTFSPVSKYLRAQGINAPAATVSRFKDGHLLARAGKFSSCHQAGSPSADDQDMGWRLSSHRSPRSLADRNSMAGLIGGSRMSGPPQYCI